MRKMGIIEIADNDINEVSGGQLQRACLCRSMMNRPKLLFADEPTGALNRTSSNEVMDELVKLNNEAESTCRWYKAYRGLRPLWFALPENDGRTD